MAREIDLQDYLLSLDSSSTLTFVECNDSTAAIKQVYEKTVNLFANLTVKLAKETKVQEISKAELKSGKHFFVFEKYDPTNPAQAYVKAATIYGLGLITQAIENDVPLIYRESNVIFGTAFKDMIICPSNIHTSFKKELGSLIQAMNGTFQMDITSETTHLITNSTLSIKYIEAAKRNIPIYHVDWIKKVFADTMSQKIAGIKADDEKYSNYILPPFFDLKVTTTGVPRDEREKIRDAIEEHGGTFEETFRKDVINVLIVGGDTISDKVRVAKANKIERLVVEWVYDSIKAKHSLPYEDYRAFEDNSKTLTNQAVPEFKQPTVAQNKIVIPEVIPSPEKEVDDDSETLCSQRTCESIMTQPQTEVAKTTAEMINNLTLAMAKKAGNIFDGVCFHFHDFSFADLKKMKKILMSCGAFVRELDENVTHILCTNPARAQNEITKTVKEKNLHPIIVKFEWIVECMEKAQLVPIDKELIVRDFSVKPTPANVKENAGMVMPNKIISNSKPLEDNNRNKQNPNSAQKRKLSSVPPKKVKRAKFEY